MGFNGLLQQFDGLGNVVSTIDIYSANGLGLLDETALVGIAG